MSPAGYAICTLLTAEGLTVLVLWARSRAYAAQLSGRDAQILSLKEQVQNLQNQAKIARMSDADLLADSVSGQSAPTGTATSQR